MITDLASKWRPVQGGFTAPSGYLAAGIRAGLKPSGKPDLALLIAPERAVCAGTFTQNLVRAACIDLCAERLRASAGAARAVLINSGQANACTGERGMEDSLTATASLARQLGCAEQQVLMCSTGVIGVPLPMSKLLDSLNTLCAAAEPEGGSAAAQAILTTDLVDKQWAIETVLRGRSVRIGGMAKGSGMIHPDMATMLAFISCDMAVPQPLWSEMVSHAVERSFNAITVDGDTSTNDCLLAFAAGSPFEPEDLDALRIGLTMVCQQLARAIARDGEGATCLLEVNVRGTGTNQEARQVARTVCASSLVKTAVHGRDPNWGRIIAAAGRAGVSFAADQVALWLGGQQLIRDGQPIDFDCQAAAEYMQVKASASYLVDDSVLIELELGSGSGEGHAWGCDLSDQYVRINADYTT